MKHPMHLLVLIRAPHVGHLWIFLTLPIASRSLAASVLGLPVIGAESGITKSSLQKIPCQRFAGRAGVAIGKRCELA